ncbi:unnamed protein product [Phytophthora fragariaefolia]|uniref:Unnamed protein product n=1 Tax=Phytophthora fragariaefolia TaxID=1490495 RepID=A0A9W6WLL4_9STRA|nr:unnamed protein product [Phytophthora fragariaefolia]
MTIRRISTLTARKSVTRLRRTNGSSWMTGLLEPVLEEPGVWTFSVKCYPWVWMDKSQLDDQGRPFTLMEQFKIVNKLEPARVQWSSCDSDGKRVVHLNSSLRKKLLPESERRRYPVSTQRP